MKKIESIKNKFGKLKKEIDEKNVSNIGVLDLRKYASNILRFQEESNRIKEESRYDSNIDLDDLAVLFRNSEELWGSMSETLDSINAELDEKNEKIREYAAEISRQKDIINMYFDKINIYTEMAQDDANILNNKEIDSELEKLCNEELDFEDNKLAKLRESMEKHVNVCKGINIEINLLRYGGEARKEEVNNKKGKKLDDNSFTNGLPAEVWDKVFLNGFTEETWDNIFVKGPSDEVWDSIQ